MVPGSIGRCPTAAIECQRGSVACRPPQGCGADGQTRDILFRLCPTSDYDLLFDDTTRAGALREIQSAGTWRSPESYLATILSRNSCCPSIWLSIRSTQAHQPQIRLTKITPWE